jgi:signal transduction histidine kinase
LPCEFSTQIRCGPEADEAERATKGHLLRSKRQSVRLALVQLFLMAGVVAAFFVDALMGMGARHVIHDDAEAITANAVSSIQYATRARGDARRIATWLRETVSATASHPVPPPESELGELSQDLEASLAGCLALETLPEEEAFHRELAASKVEFDREMSATLAAVDAHDVERAEARLAVAQRAHDSLDEAIERVVAFNSDQAQRLSARIERTRHDTDRGTLVGHGLVALLAMAATASASLVLRQSLAALHERMTELDMFAGRVAHDLMSPLMAVASGLAVLKARLPDNSACIATVDRAARSLERVRALASGLLEYARAGAKADGSGSTPVEDTLRDVVEELQPEAVEASVRLECALQSSSCVRCPPGGLVSLAQNLVRNAIKHMGERSIREVRVLARDAGCFVHVVVEDTGPGVPSEILPRLFEPFVRGSQASSGSGIGLSTVKKLAEAYGGRVGCRSTHDAGSVFWFELPRA